MKNVAISVASLLIMLGMTSAAASAADTYKVDPAHSFINFKIRHLGVSNAWGRFDGPTGTVAIDDADPSKSSFDLQARTDKVDTGNPKARRAPQEPGFFQRQAVSHALVQEYISEKEQR